MGEADFTGRFSTPRPAFLSGAAGNQRLAKTGMDLGALGSTQKQGPFHNLLIIKVSAKEALAMGWKTCPAPETVTGTERERWKDAAPGSGECERMAGRRERRAGTRRKRVQQEGAERPGTCQDGERM